MVSGLVRPAPLQISNHFTLSSIFSNVNFLHYDINNVLKFLFVLGDSERKPPLKNYKYEKQLLE